MLVRALSRLFMRCPAFADAAAAASINRLPIKDDLVASIPSTHRTLYTTYILLTVLYGYGRTETPVPRPYSSTSALFSSPAGYISACSCESGLKPTWDGCMIWGVITPGPHIYSVGVFYILASPGPESLSPQLCPPDGPMNDSLYYTLLCFWLLAELIVIAHAGFLLLRWCRLLAAGCLRGAIGEEAAAAGI